MAGFIGRVAATAAGITLYEVAVRPLIVSRMAGRVTQADDELEAKLERELDELEAEEAREADDTDIPDPEF